MSKYLISVIAIFGFSFSNVAGITPKNDYINRFSATAIQEKNLYNVLACISMAQGILESCWGESILATHNNHFGIKCHNNWEGSSFDSKDDDYDADGKLIESCFRAYDTAEESWRDHSMFLQQTRYQSLFNYGSDYRAWAVGLQSSGYATNPKYAEKLIRLIELYELYRLDGLTDAIPAPDVLLVNETNTKEDLLETHHKLKLQNASTVVDETLAEITPKNETSFDEHTEDEIDVPQAEILPEGYLRNQGKKIVKDLECLFQNLKKAELPKKIIKVDEQEELDEIVPNNGKG